MAVVRSLVSLCHVQSWGAVPQVDLEQDTDLDVLNCFLEEPSSPC